MSKSISIVIPAYNEERYLAACLDAIVAQTEAPDQVIVVDNNSTDRTVAIARSYDFVTLVRAKKQGVVYGRDAGFDANTCDIIGRIDADSRLPADWVMQVKRFYDDPVHAACALTGGVICYNLRFPRLVSLIQDQIVFRLNRFLLGHYILFGSNMALPAEAWKAVRQEVCSRPDIHEDLDLSIHLRQAGFHIAYRAWLRAGVKMRRVRSDHQTLWDNLQWWPRTLRTHGNKRWPIAWSGALLLYVCSPLLPAMEKVARLFGSKPLAE
jgi:glycosyltransferase involved in cell wall biosynthesis